MLLSHILLATNFSSAEIAQLGERQTEDLKVPGSNPENSHEFWIIPGLGIFLLLWFLLSRSLLFSNTFYYFRELFGTSHFNHTHQYQPIQTLVPVLFFLCSRWQSSHKDIHSVGICTGPSCKNALEWSPDSSNIPSRPHHGYLIQE